MADPPTPIALPTNSHLPSPLSLLPSSRRPRGALCSAGRPRLLLCSYLLSSSLSAPVRSLTAGLASRAESGARPNRRSINFRIDTVS